jgi:hypothetical protein
MIFLEAWLCLTFIRASNTSGFALAFVVPYNFAGFIISVSLKSWRRYLDFFLNFILLPRFCKISLLASSLSPLFDPSSKEVPFNTEFECNILVQFGDSAASNRFLGAGLLNIIFEISLFNDRVLVNWICEIYLPYKSW